MNRRGFIKTIGFAVAISMAPIAFNKIGLRTVGVGRTEIEFFDGTPVASFDAALSDAEVWEAFDDLYDSGRITERSQSLFVKVFPDGEKGYVKALSMLDSSDYTDPNGHGSDITLAEAKKISQRETLEKMLGMAAEA